MKSPPVKVHWLDRAIQVHNFHVSQLKDEPNWTIRKTAKALNRSLGSVCQDILLARWSRTHYKQLKRYSSMRDALEFVRSKQQENNTREVDA